MDTVRRFAEELSQATFPFEPRSRRVYPYGAVDHFGVAFRVVPIVLATAVGG
jgi:hypothetical protein